MLIVLVLLAMLLAAGLLVRAAYLRDLDAAARRALAGSSVIETRCGPLEMQQAGTGTPVLVIHGSGGGHDQGMAWARGLVAAGARVIAPSRFGYLGTPRPHDASPEAQADAHACLLDALAVRRAVVIGYSAGAPSALALALRHPQRVAALALVVPIAWKPGDAVDSAPPVSDAKDAWLLRLLGSDFLFWAATRFARDAVIRHVLATPPAEVAAASAAERARIDELVDRILPVSLRVAGLADDTGLGKRLGPWPLQSIDVPTVVISARNDGFGTHAAAEYVASQVPGARFVGFEDGGHLLAGHGAQVEAELAALIAMINPPR
jgi:pimeloyl-ACP methyl ester carboxylesterase